MGILGLPLNSRFWGGISWLTYRYVQHLPRLFEDDEFHLVLYEPLGERFQQEWVGELERRHGNLHVHVLSKGREAISWCEENTDVVWGPSMGILRTKRIPQVFTHSDMRMFSPWRDTYKHFVTHKLGLDYAMRHAKMAITFSDFTYRETFKHYTDPAHRRKTDVVYLGIPAGFERDEEIEPLRPECVGSREFISVVYDPLPQKRMDMLRRVTPLLEERGWDLVMIGGMRGRRVDVVIDHPHVHYPGFFGHDELPRVIRASKLFLFTSEYEGFGLPPYEAMFLEVPVLYNRRCAALSMDIGDRTHSFDGEDDLLTSLDAVLGSDELRARHVEEGRAFAESFDWEVSTRRYMYLFEKAHEMREAQVDFTHSIPLPAKEAVPGRAP